MPNNLLEVIWSGERLVHAEIFVFIIAVFQTTTLVFHGSVDGRCGSVDVQSGPGWDVDRRHWLVVAFLPGSLLSLLFALVFGLLLVV